MYANSVRGPSFILPCSPCYLNSPLFFGHFASCFNRSLSALLVSLFEPVKPWVESYRKYRDLLPCRSHRITERRGQRKATGFSLNHRPRSPWYLTYTLGKDLGRHNMKGLMVSVSFMSVVLGGTPAPSLDKEMTALPDDPCDSHLPTLLHGSFFGTSIQL